MEWSSIAHGHNTTTIFLNWTINNNNNNHAALWNFWGWKHIYVPYSSSVTSIREFWEGFQLVWIMFILSLFLGVKFVCVNIYISCFYIFNIGARSPWRSSISEENEVPCMQPCRYNLCFCLYRFALFYKLVSYLLEYIKSIYHRLEMDTSQETIILHGREKNWRGRCVICIY